MIRCCSRSFVGLGTPFDISTSSMQAGSGRVLWMTAGSHVHDNRKTCHSERAGLLRMTVVSKAGPTRFANGCGRLSPPSISCKFPPFVVMLLSFSLFSGFLSIRRFVFRFLVLFAFIRVIRSFVFSSIRSFVYSSFRS